MGEAQLSENNDWTRLGGYTPLVRVAGATPTGSKLWLRYSLRRAAETTSSTDSPRRKHRCRRPAPSRCRRGLDTSGRFEGSGDALLALFRRELGEPRLDDLDRRVEDGLRRTRLEPREKLRLGGRAVLDAAGTSEAQDGFALGLGDLALGPGHLHQRSEEKRGSGVPVDPERNRAAQKLRILEPESSAKASAISCSFAVSRIFSSRSHLSLRKNSPPAPAPGP